MSVGSGANRFCRSAAERGDANTTFMPETTQWSEHGYVENLSRMSRAPVTSACRLSPAFRALGQLYPWSRLRAGA